VKSFGCVVEDRLLAGQQKHWTTARKTRYLDHSITPPVRPTTKTTQENYARKQRTQEVGYTLATQQPKRKDREA